MKRLFTLTLFLFIIGICSNVKAQLVKEVTLTSANTLAAQLGDEAAKVTTLKISGPLGEADFKTMKESMTMLQVLDMNGVTELPLVGSQYQGEQLPGIPEAAFQNKQTLQHVIFPEIMQRIDDYAFEGCNNLTVVDFTNAGQLKQIRDFAFQNCSALRVLDFSSCSALEELLGDTFSACRNLQTVSFSGCANLRTVGESDHGNVFSVCSSLQLVDFTGCSALTTISRYSFGECSRLTTVKLDGCTSLSSINSSVFSNCSKLSDFDFSKLTYLKSIGSNAFRSCSLSGDIVFASGIKEIGESAFYNNDNITSFDFSLSGDLTVISSGTFGDCERLTRVDFSNCSSLNTLDIGAFDNCPSLEEVRINNGFYTSIDGVLFVVDKATLLYYPAGKKAQSYTIPSTVMTIGERSFSYNESLMELTIPKSVLTIKGGAFYNGAFTRNAAKVIMESASPIGLSQSIGLEDALVYVPKGSAEAYRSASIWSESIILDINPDHITINIDEGSTLQDKLREMKLSPVSIQNLTISGALTDKDFKVLESMTYLSKLDISKAFISNQRLVDETLRDSRALSFLILPNHLYYIGHFSFYSSRISNGVILPSNLKVIENGAFHSGAPSFIKFRALDLPYMSGEAFYSADRLSCVLYLPRGMKERFLNDNFWSKFKNIEEYGNLVVTSTNGLGYVSGAGAYDDGDLVSLRAIITDQDLYGEYYFGGWYENGEKISTEPELTFVMGDTDRNIEARFYNDQLALDGVSFVINDANKVDGQEVILWNADLTVDGVQPWKPKSLTYYRGSSLVVNSDILTDNIAYLSALPREWCFICLPYDLKLSEIKLPSSDIMMVAREYDGNSRADNGIGSSWRQLSRDAVMKANKGYIIKTNAYSPVWGAFTTKTGDMKALFNRGSVTIPLNTYASKLDLDANWNLVGNPYPSYYSVEQLYEDGLDATVTVWSPEMNNYEYYTKDDKDVYLSPLTAFFIQKNKSDLKFSPEGRVANPSSTTYSEPSLRSADGRRVINLLLAGEKSTDRTRVVFNENASLNYEIGLDAAKFKSMSQDVPSFYSYDKSGNMLAINERPTDNGKVELGCDLPAAGSYTISLKEKVDGEIHLFDKETGAICDLNSESYSFTAKAGTVSGRFELRSGLPTSIEQIAERFGWRVVDGKLTLTGLSNISRVAIHDAAGHTCYSGKAADGDMSISLPRTGIYFITLTTNSGEQHTCSVKW